MFPNRLGPTLTINEDLILQKLVGKSQDVLPAAQLRFLMELRNWDKAIRENLFNDKQIIMPEQIMWYKQFIFDRSKLLYIICSKGNFIGYLNSDDIDVFHKKCEVGVKIAERYRRKGCGRKSFEFWLQTMFGFLEMEKIYLYVRKSNEIAVGLYNSMGFEIEGVLGKHYIKNGQRVDILMMSVFKHTFAPSTLRG